MDSKSFASEPQSDRAPPPLSRADKAPAGLGLLLEAVDRIERLVDAETAALKRFRALDLREFNDRKSRALLDLTRAVRALNGGRLDAGASARLKVLRGKLAANQAVLATHLKAAKEITTMVADTIRDSESDGTYSNILPARNKAPW